MLSENQEARVDTCNMQQTPVKCNRKGERRIRKKGARFENGEGEVREEKAEEGGRKRCPRHRVRGRERRPKVGRRGPDWRKLRPTQKEGAMSVFLESF